MQVFHSEQLVELKYCERCGGLWLRHKGYAGIYCKACKQEMAEYPIAHPKPNRAGRRAETFDAIQAVGTPIPQSAPRAFWPGSVL